MEIKKMKKNYTATIEKKEFVTDDGATREYYAIEIDVNGEIIKVEPKVDYKNLLKYILKKEVFDK
jgi:hypothetical protein